VDFDEIAKSGTEAGNGFENNILGRVDELLHVLWGV
jgi:hypothetical protein